MSHWVVIGPANTTVTEKLRPFLRALFPTWTENKIASFAMHIYRSGDVGCSEGLYTFCRIEGNDLPRQLAEHIRSSKFSTDPREREIDIFLTRLKGRVCLA